MNHEGITNANDQPLGAVGGGGIIPRRDMPLAEVDKNNALRARADALSKGHKRLCKEISRIENLFGGEKDDTSEDRMRWNILLE